LPDKDATIQVNRSGEWKPYHVARVLFPPSADVDIAVLETSEEVSTPFQVPYMSGSDTASFGQQVWFFGYPWGIHTRFGSGEEVAFVKRGMMSAIDGSDPNATVLYIDGFNNPGFSGGPIVYWDFTKRSYRIMGLLKGYRPESAKMIIKGNPADTNLLVNSGILIGYSIKHAIQAIEQTKQK